MTNATIKAAVVVLADTETHGDMGRLVNALEAVKEFKSAGSDVRLIFDGAGTKWVTELSKPENRLHGLFESVKDKVSGVCAFCATAFGAKEGVEACGLPLTGEFEGHPSFQKLVSQEYQVITF